MENNENKVEKVIILGSGPAGLAAALYAARAELSPLVLTGTEIGGQAATTSVIENYPGFPEGVGGSELADLLSKNAENLARVLNTMWLPLWIFQSDPFNLPRTANNSRLRP